MILASRSYIRPLIQAGLPGAMMQFAKRLTESGQEVAFVWGYGMMGS